MFEENGVALRSEMATRSSTMSRNAERGEVADVDLESRRRGDQINVRNSHHNVDVDTKMRVDGARLGPARWHIEGTRVGDEKKAGI